MTVNTTDITDGPFLGNGIASTFSYNFRVEDKTQLEVFETVAATGVRTLLTVDTDYTVAGIGDDGGGIITRVAGALPIDDIWFIRSNYIENQLTAFSSQGGFFPDVHEDQMDHITFLIQQLRDELERSVRLHDARGNDGDFTIDTEADDRASTIIAFDGNGDIILLDQSTVTSVPAIFSVNKTLADGQVDVTFTQPIANASFYISGLNADSGRLTEGSQYSVNVTTKTITLVDSYPAGTLLIMVFNDTAESIVHPVATTAEIEDATDIINTTSKRAGRSVFNTTTSKLVIATGSVATDTWVNCGTGVLEHTPV